MRQKSRNTFVRGMNQDLALSLFKGDNYYSARNGRLTTDENGESTGSLTSIRGTKFDFDLPTIGDSWRIKVDVDFIFHFINGESQTLELTIGGVSRTI